MQCCVCCVCVKRDAWRCMLQLLGEVLDVEDAWCDAMLMSVEFLSLPCILEI
jgi:hypothetical protein